jgi:hypothetical protein
MNQINFDDEDDNVIISIKLSSGQTLTIDIELDKTVDDLLDVILEQYGIVKENQNVIFGGRIMERNKKLLSYGIKNNSSIYLTSYQGLIAKHEMIQIFVKSLTGTTNVIDIDTDDTVETLITLVCKKTGISREQCRLIFLGKQLERQHKLSHYGIQDGSTIHTVLNVRGD